MRYPNTELYRTNYYMLMYYYFTIYEPHLKKQQFWFDLQLQSYSHSTVLHEMSTVPIPYLVRTLTLTISVSDRQIALMGLLFSVSLPKFYNDLIFYLCTEWPLCLWGTQSLDHSIREISIDVLADLSYLSLMAMDPCLMLRRCISMQVWREAGTRTPSTHSSSTWMEQLGEVSQAKSGPDIWLDWWGMTCPKRSRCISQG